jgi:hypothetical protein
MKYKYKIENIDKFILALEEIIDARDDAHEEEQFCNYRQVDKIREERYLPAKELLREALHDLLVEAVDEKESGTDDSKAA